MKPVTIGLVGVGGYAARHLMCIEILQEEGVLDFRSVTIRSPKKYPAEVERLGKAGVTIRASLDEMIETDGAALELIAVPTGINSHRPQMIQTVEAGFPLVLEKPSAATVQDVDAMIAAQEATGKFCQIGFQSQSCPVVRGLKRRICEGRLGRIEEVVVTGLWKRSNKYYERNPWAGKYAEGDDYILDGTINNPFAHQLFNALYYASPEWGHATEPVSVRAELYHANDIESEDTSAVEVFTRNGARILLFATLTAQQVQNPMIEIIGDKARAVYCSDGWAKIYDGEAVAEEIDTPEDVDSRVKACRNVVETFRNAADYLRGIDSELNCPIAMTRPHVAAVNGAFESVRRPIPVPADAIECIQEPESDETSVHIKDIEAVIHRAAAQRKLFSDLGVPWAKATQPFSVENYKTFSLRL